jgi:3',5'-nucleoside bisphosphate phosphatase
MIDLHSHTDQSDGTFAPHELVEAACRIGLEALAISDHDTLAGYDLAVPLAAEAGLELVCAIELSSRPEHKPGEKRPPSTHLLGYFPERAPTREFRQWLRTQQDGRRRRNLALVSKLQSLGVVITLDEVQSVGRHLTGRPHFAQVLQSKGYVHSRQEAFDVYLADHAQAAVERDEPTPEEAIRRVRAAGGLPVVAHPCRLPQRDSASLAALLERWVEVGLEGIEVYYSEHSPEQVELYARMARRFGLAVTGGSDFHGATKPGIALGTGRNGSLQVPYSILENMKTAHLAMRKAS